MEKTKKNDFVEIKYTGFANGEIFDSNIEEDFKKLNSKDKPTKVVVAIGHGMVMDGLDDALDNKAFGPEYEILISVDDAFGPRKRELIKTIPLAHFAEQKVNPQPGMVLSLDNQVVKIIAVSGARVTADFNNPLAGKEIKYKFKILRKVTDTKEKAEAFFNFFLRYIPEFGVKEKEVVVKGPKLLDSYIDAQKSKFKDLIGFDLKFQEKKDDEKKPEVKEHLKSPQGVDEAQGRSSKSDSEKEEPKKNPTPTQK
jgi:FKBP-type peptidyl-prolyl cis-trans isomerase 2